MFGVYFNLSLWYKVTDRTHWGAILSIVGCALTVLLIALLAPRYGFMACAWASVVANGGVMLISYTLGQHYYPVSYDLRRLALYTLLTIILYGMQWGIANALPEAPLLRMLFNTLLLLIFLGIVYRYEVPKGMLIALRKKLLHR